MGRIDIESVEEYAGGAWEPDRSDAQSLPCFDSFETGSSLESLSTQELGKLGERLAAEFLRSRSYEVVECNYRCPEGEADIVAYDPDEDEVVLVEVKTRRVLRAGAELYPEEAVDARKRRRYRRIASCYAMSHFPTSRIRFDVVAISFGSPTTGFVEHLIGAFDWDVGQ